MKSIENILDMEETWFAIADYIVFNGIVMFVKYVPAVFFSYSFCFLLFMNDHLVILIAYKFLIKLSTNKKNYCFDNCG